MLPYCEDPSIRPSYVNNGMWKNCNISQGKTRCDLVCDPGYLPDGNGKWVCEKGKITHPVHSCAKVYVPAQNSDCRTPHLEHGVYACSWTKECHGKDDNHVHRRGAEDARGGGHSHKGNSYGGSNNKHDHDNSKNLCKRQCSLQCDVGWKPLSGNKEATCIRHTREWINKSTICVPDNYKPGKKPGKGYKGEGNEDRTEPTDNIKPTVTTTAVTGAIAKNPCAVAEDHDADTGWGYGQCPDLTDPLLSPCLPSVPQFDEGKEKLSNKVYWVCSPATEKNPPTCTAECGPSAVRSSDGIMECKCKKRKDKNGVTSKMCTWSGKIKNHCIRK